MFSTVILIGRSGCGKGLQSSRLVEGYAGRDLLYIETGERLRELSRKSGLTPERVATEMAAGSRLPDFLGIWSWGEAMVQELTADKVLVLDGAPRSLLEAQVLDTAFNFYRRQPVVVVYLRVSREQAVARLLGRNRADDTMEDIARRQDWFEQDVQPAIDFFRHNERYKLFEIDGEKGPDEVAADIKNKLWPG